MELDGVPKEFEGDKIKADERTHKTMRATFTPASWNMMSKWWGTPDGTEHEMVLR